MTLTSKKTNNGETEYAFTLTENEFDMLNKGVTIVKHVEWSQGQGKFELTYKPK